MTSPRRTILWPIIIIAVGSIWLLMVAGAFPEAVGDILMRAWPALLILFGFDMLVGRRRLRISRWQLPLNVAGLVITLALLGGVVWFAYAKQADEVRADQVKVLAEPLGEGISRIRLEAALTRTGIRLEVADENTVSAEFKGSRESAVEMTSAVEGETLVINVSESNLNSIPKLEDYGRSTLILRVPAGTAIERLDLSSSEGGMVLDLQPLSVERVALESGQGDVKVILPAENTLTGTMVVADGGLELQVPPNMALTVEFQGQGRPNYQYDQDNYQKLEGGPLESEDANGQFQISLDVTLDNGANFTLVDIQ